MLNLRQITTVYRKELLDALRDRRTIISTIVIPIVMFPLIFVGFGMMAEQSMKRARGETANIALLGAENSPALAEAIRKTETIKIEKSSADYTNRISNKSLRAAIEIPPDFEKPSGTNPPVVKIYHYAGEVRSQMAVRNLQTVVRNHRDRMVEQTLTNSGLSKAVLTPFETRDENVAPPTKVGGNLLGGFVPYLIIFLSFVGCIAPALDLTAGEKERGTIETILASPIGRTELVIGKFLLVLTTSMTTTMLALASNAITLAVPLFLTKEISKGGSLPFDVSPTGVAGVFILVFPLAVTFAATLLAIGSCARTYKEAQTYVSPLMMIVVLPAMAALLPGFELTFARAFIPILNVTLISKEVLTGTFHWGLISMVFLSSCLYAMAALAAAVAAFKSESVLFRT